MASRSQSRPNKGIPPGRGPYGVGCLDVMAGLSTSGVFFRLYYPTEKTPDGPPAEQRPKWLPHSQYAKGYGNVVGKKLAGTVLKWLLCKVTLPVSWYGQLSSKKPKYPVVIYSHGLGDAELPIAVLDRLEYSPGNGKCKVTLPVSWYGQLSSKKPKYPVVIYSHGLGGCRTAYSSTCIDMASCGCFVAAVEHRDKSACRSFTLDDKNSNEEGGNSDKERYQWLDFHAAPYDTEELRNKQVYQRKDECIAALDYLQDMNEGSQLDNDLDPDCDLAQFQGKLDMDNVAVAGHSFGGATTVACLSRDDRFKCGVGFDVWMFPLDESHLKVEQPVLFINTEGFQWRENMTKLLPLIPNLQATSGPRQMITIRGTVHVNQSDFSLLVPKFLAKLVQLRGPLDPYVAMEINNSAAIRFLAKYLDLDTPDETDSPSATNHIIIGTNVNLEAEPAKEDAKHDREGHTDHTMVEHTRERTESMMSHEHDHDHGSRHDHDHGSRHDHGKDGRKEDHEMDDEMKEEREDDGEGKGGVDEDQQKKVDEKTDDNTKEGEDDR